MRASVCRKLLLVAALLFAGIAQAAPEWASLSAQEQAVLSAALKGGAEQYLALPEARRDALVRGTRHWLAMSDTERAEANRQLAEWRSLSQQERAAALAQRDAFRALSPAEKNALLQRQKQFKGMSDTDRQRTREVFMREQRRQRRDLAPPASPSTANPADALPDSPHTIGAGVTTPVLGTVGVEITVPSTKP